MFIKVRIPSLNECSKLILDKVSNAEIKKREIIKTRIDRKYLLISDCSILEPEKIHRWATVQIVKVFLGMPVIPGK